MKSAESVSDILKLMWCSVGSQWTC